MGIAAIPFSCSIGAVETTRSQAWLPQHNLVQQTSSSDTRFALQLKIITWNGKHSDGTTEGNVLIGNSPLVTGEGFLEAIT